MYIIYKLPKIESGEWRVENHCLLGLCWF